MRKLVALLAVTTLLGACRSGSTTGTMPGAQSPKAAAESFLNAVRAQDLQAMSNFWGTTKGPARNSINRSELERRELIMQCSLAHDRVRWLDEVPRAGGRRLFTVELGLRSVTRTTTVTTVQGPSERWYVEEVDLRTTQDLCVERNRVGGQ